MATNYQLILDKTLEKLVKNGEKKKLLLHACCAPCSSYCLEYLSNYMDIDVLFYNPNISMKEEFLKRQIELERLITSMPFKHKVQVRTIDYIPEEFYEAVPNRKEDREGGESCFLCYKLRLERTAKIAKEEGYDFFTTTLSISPLKNAGKLNEIGEELSKVYGVDYLFSDFKKKNGYKRSIELSKEYDLYRQNYCGCIFSKKEREES
jgi:hypothetical protein